MAEQVNRTRAVEHRQADSLATIGAKHEEDRTAAATVPAAVVADLRAGRLQLRDDLATCNTARLSEAVAGAVERDAHAQLRAEVAGDLVQIGRDADDQIRACQAVIAADRMQAGR
ncbi:MAG: lysis system i-spanin subunit Rz [Stenotrophomonas maltophilia]|nr:lysis system i-spanin subunit Rz [Stenotrophomonas maltophilia]